MRTSPGERLFWCLFGGCCVAALLPLWLVEYLPMADLPQHAVQIAIWRHWNDPGFGAGGLAYHEIYRPSWFTPYLGGYSLAALFSLLVPVPEAIKVVLSLAAIGIPVATLRLLRESGGDRWWVFSCFPVLVGRSFYLGFFNYLVGLPLLLLWIGLGLRYSRAPTRRLWWSMLALSIAVFFAHVFLFAFGLVVLGLFVWQRAPGLGETLQRLRPCYASIVLAGAWVLAVRRHPNMETTRPLWSWGWYRLRELPTNVAGMGPGVASVLLFLALFALPFVVGARPSAKVHRWLPFALALALFFFLPFANWGIAYVYPRLGVLLVPTFLIGLDRRRATLRWWRFLPGALLVLLWSIGVTDRFRTFNEDVGDFDALLETMPRERRVLGLIVDQSSSIGKEPLLGHFASWYQVVRGGIADYSFAEAYPEIFHYRPGLAPSLRPALETNPLHFEWDLDGADLFDYFLVRTDGSDRSRALFKGARERVELVAQRGAWWLYEKRAEP